MVNFISNHLETIISAIVGFVSGGITVHIYHKNNSDNTKTIQKILRLEVILLVEISINN